LAANESFLSALQGRQELHRNQKSQVISQPAHVYSMILLGEKYHTRVSQALEKLRPEQDEYAFEMYVYKGFSRCIPAAGHL
jgi:hypothetical protein